MTAFDAKIRVLLPRKRHGVPPRRNRHGAVEYSPDWIREAWPKPRAITMGDVA